MIVAGELHAEQLVFVDECSTDTSLAPLYAWSPKRRASILFGAAQLGS